MKKRDQTHFGQKVDSFLLLMRFMSIWCASANIGAWPTLGLCTNCIFHSRPSTCKEPLTEQELPDLDLQERLFFISQHSNWASQEVLMSACYCVISDRLLFQRYFSAKQSKFEPDTMAQLVAIFPKISLCPKICWSTCFVIHCWELHCPLFVVTSTSVLKLGGEGVKSILTMPETPRLYRLHCTAKFIHLMIQPSP